MTFIEIPKQSIVDRKVPVGKVFSRDDPFYGDVESIWWEGSINPRISNVTPEISATKRYEELQIFHVEITDKESLFDIARRICRKVKYLCLIEFQYNDATSVGCVSFNKGKRNSDDNVNVTLFLSHWIRDDYMSKPAARMIERINNLIQQEINLKDMNEGLINAVSDYPIGGINKAHVDRIIRHMVGSSSTNIRSLIKQYCIPIHYWPYNDLSEKFDFEKRGAGYRLIHDKEELWYCFNKCPDIKRVIEGRRYRDIEDLIHSIDEKLEEHR